MKISTRDPGCPGTVAGTMEGVHEAKDTLFFFHFCGTSDRNLITKKVAHQTLHIIFALNITYGNKQMQK